MRAAFVTVGQFAQTHDASAIGFGRALATLAGTSARLCGFAKGPVMGDQVRISFGQDQLTLSAGLNTTAITIVNGRPIAQRAIAIDAGPRDLLDQTVRHIMQADGMLVIDAARVLFTRDGKTLVSFAL